MTRPHFSKLCFSHLVSVFAILLAMSSGSVFADVPTHAIRIMSFNLRYGTANDGDNRWELRKDLVVETIRGLDPDILGTQETLPFQAEFLQQHLTDHVYIGRSREPDNANGEQCGIFIRKNRFYDLEQGHFWLSETPDVPGSKSWDSSLPRMVTWLKLFDRTTGRTLYVFNTHFDHRGSKAREESAKLVRDRIVHLPKDARVVLTGDFNCGEDSAPYRSLLAKPASFLLVDSYRHTHPEKSRNEGTFNGFTGQMAGARIDWIIANSNLKIWSADIVRHSKDGRYPSDHFPVTAVVSDPDAEASE